MTAQTLSRRRLIALCAGAAWLAAGPVLAASGKPLVEVWKSPSCGCCTDWIAHLQASGFEVRAHDTGNTAMRNRMGIGERYGSCHTALVGVYALEGHVPAREVRRLLAERPQAIGLAVPGMPIGTPGMDGAEYGGQKDPYDVLLLLKDGGAKVYASYR